MVVGRCAQLRERPGTHACRETKVAAQADPITLELFKNAIFSIADEMALTVFRTTCSGVLKDNMDYSTGFADADGRLAAQGLTLPGHLGSVPTAMAAIMRRFKDDIAPGKLAARVGSPALREKHKPGLLAALVRNCASS